MGREAPTEEEEEVKKQANCMFPACGVDDKLCPDCAQSCLNGHYPHPVLYKGRTRIECRRCDQVLEVASAAAGEPQGEVPEDGGAQTPAGPPSVSPGRGPEEPSVTLSRDQLVLIGRTFLHLCQQYDQMGALEACSVLLSPLLKGIQIPAEQVAKPPEKKLFIPRERIPR